MLRFELGDDAWHVETFAHEMPVVHFGIDDQEIAGKPRPCASETAGSATESSKARAGVSGPSHR